MHDLGGYINLFNKYLASLESGDKNIVYVLYTMFLPPNSKLAKYLLNATWIVLLISSSFYISVSMICAQIFPQQNTVIFD